MSTNVQQEEFVFLSVVKEELAHLAYVVGYADSNLAQGGDLKFVALKRYAYQKTIVINWERQGLMVYRTGVVSAPITGRPSLMYATPYSDMGRLCAVAYEGLTAHSEKFGDYEVEEVRVFTRFADMDARANLLNFKHMRCTFSDKERGDVEDLQAYVRDAESRSGSMRLPLSSVAVKVEPLEPPAVERYLLSEDLTPEPVQREESAPNSPAESRRGHSESTAAMPSAADEYNADSAWDDEDVDVPVKEGCKQNRVAGLSDMFYMSRTMNQEAVMGRNPVGPLFVQGVAGSGKTSAALGRMKMLCDFTSDIEVQSERDFRAVVGDLLEYWEKDFRGKFLQESCVGFVRTGELLAYLSETCRRLDLSHMPIKEYSWLRSELIGELNLLKRSANKSVGWRLHSNTVPSVRTTSMSWLIDANKAVLAQIVADLPTALPTAQQVVESLFSSKVEGDSVVAKAVLTREAQVHRNQTEVVVRIVLDSLSAGLERGLSKLKSGQRLCLRGLAQKIWSQYEQVRQAMLSKDSLWLTLGLHTDLVPKVWWGPDEKTLARKLVESGVRLEKAGNILLVLDDLKKPIAPNLSFSFKDGRPFADIDLSLRGEASKLERGDVVVKDAQGVWGRVSVVSLSTLAIWLGKDSMGCMEGRFSQPMGGDLNPLRGLIGEELRWFNKEWGLGAVAAPVASLPQATPKAQPSEETEASVPPATPVASEAKSKSLARHMDTVAAKLLRILFQDLGLIYKKALSNHAELFSDPEVVKAEVHELEKGVMSHSVVDLLLCMANLIGEDFSGKVEVLKPQKMFDAVFIDEVQDFTEQQVFLMSRQANPEYEAVTLVGDLQQRLHTGTGIDVQSCFVHPNVPKVELLENLRQQGEPGLAWFSACVRAKVSEAAVLPPPTEKLKQLLTESVSVRGPEVRVVTGDLKVAAEIVSVLKEVGRGQSAAVIFPDAARAQSCFALCQDDLEAEGIAAEVSAAIQLGRNHVRHFTAVANAKGLEFDVVVVPYVGAYALQDVHARNSLYVALSRACGRLVVVLEEGDQNNAAFYEIWDTYVRSLKEMGTLLV